MPKFSGTSTSPRPSPHFAPPTPQNAEREKRSQFHSKIISWVGEWSKPKTYSGQVSLMMGFSFKAAGSITMCLMRLRSQV